MIVRQSKAHTDQQFATAQGTCFSTRGAPLRHQVKYAGDASSFTVVTMHSSGDPFDPLFTSPDLYGSTGLNCAVVDDEVAPMAAVVQGAMTVLPGAHPLICLVVISVCVGTGCPTVEHASCNQEVMGLKLSLCCGFIFPFTK